jgi:hypothetical protein
MYNFGHNVSVYLSKAYKGFFANKLCPALRPIEKNYDITQLMFRFYKKATIALTFTYLAKQIK